MGKSHTGTGGGGGYSSAHQWDEPGGKQCLIKKSTQSRDISSKSVRDYQQ